MTKPKILKKIPSESTKKSRQATSHQRQMLISRKMYPISVKIKEAERMILTTIWKQDLLKRVTKFRVGPADDIYFICKFKNNNNLKFGPLNTTFLPHYKRHFTFTNSW